jgi:beta-glucosidase
MLKNKDGILPLEEKLNVYIPQRYIAPGRDWFGRQISERWVDAVNLDVVKKYYNLVSTPDQADVALVFISVPRAGSGYSPDDLRNGGNGYMPISLQYKPYTADYAREHSIAGGSVFEDFTNRSYKGKNVKTANESDLNMVIDTREKMGNKPVIVIINVSNPVVLNELESKTDALLIHVGIQDQAIMDIISGEAEPSGLLPFQMPSGMRTVEEQYEDVPRDMECYTDSEGNTYDFAFGLHWSGIINDDRVRKYK